MPTTELVAPINRAVLPGYAKMATCLQTLRQGYLNVIAVIALVALPAAFGIAATAELFVVPLLGEQWVDAIPVIQILSIYGVLMCLQTNAGAAFTVLGKPALLALASAVFLAVLVPLVVLGVQISPNGAIGASWAYVAAASVFTVVNFSLLTRSLKLAPMRIVSVLWRPIAAAALMFWTVTYFNTHIGSTVRPTAALVEQLLALGAAVAVGIVVYIFTIALLWLASGCPQSMEYLAVRRIRRFINNIISPLSSSHLGTSTAS